MACNEKSLREAGFLFIQMKGSNHCLHMYLSCDPIPYQKNLIAFAPFVYKRNYSAGAVNERCANSASSM